MTERKKISNINEEFDLKLFFHIARRNILYVFILLGVSTTTAFFYLRYTPAVYESYSIVKLGTENKASEILSNGTKVEQRSSNQIAGEIELIRSNIIMEKAVASLPLSVSYKAQGAVLANDLYKASPFRVDAEVKDSSMYGNPFFIDFDQASNSYQLSNQLKSKAELKKYPLNEWVEIPGLKIRVSVQDFEAINKHQSDLKHGAFIFSIDNQKDLAISLLKSMDVMLLNQDAQTLQIRFRDGNPKKATDLANAVAFEFIHYDLGKKSEASDKILSFITEQLDNVNTDLRISENLLEQFKQSNKLIKPETFANNIFERLNDLENQKVNAELEITVLSKIEQNLDANKDYTTVITLMHQNNGENALEGINASLNALLIEKDQLLLKNTYESNEVKNLNVRINAQKKLLLDAVKSAKKSIIDRASSIQMRIIEYEAKLSGLPSKEAEFSRLERLYNINQKFYSLLLEKRTEFQIKKAGYVTNNVLLQEASIPTFRLSPNRTLIGSSSILLGILAGFLIILVKYLFHNEITSLEEIEKYTPAARLGIIPKYKHEVPVSMLLVDKNPKSLISEAFRSVRTNMQFISNTDGPKIVAVTSTISGEGKTFIAINLAGVIAFSGKKVIVLDLDMRKPKIHLGFTAENTKGMSTILIEKDTIENCIHKSSLENLHYITAGPIPPNPSELILSKNMTSMLEHLKTIYDVIIIDTPPVGIVTDGLDIIQKADYPLYILRANYSKKIFIRNINKLLDDNGISRLSVILNNAESAHSKYGYSYGYGYNYGYGGYYGGYGYGYYDEDKGKSGNSWLNRIFSKKV